MVIKKHWSLLTTKQKRHRLYRVLQNKQLYFWGVCGKDRQRYYESLWLDESNVDLVRDQIYGEYMSKISKIKIFDKNNMIERIQMLLGKGEYEKVLHTLDI